jgi:cell wall-associated NlpC family hydrolase
LWSDKKSVRTGGTVQLTGQVSYGLTPNLVRAQVMKLQVKSGEAWTDVAARDAAADGHVVFTVKPAKSTTYRLAYPGVPALAGSASAATTLTVISPSPATVTSGSATNAPAVAASGRGAQVVAAAAAQTGKPYQYGAAGPNAFDCSGLTLYAFRTVGITLPHNANAQKSYGTAVSRANARPGDLIVFLSGGYGYHVAIYAGGNYMYDAPNPGTPVGKHQIYGGTVIFRRLV